MFARLQNAYSVLSDVNERAWYDAHREAILRKQSQDSLLSSSSLMSFFSPSLFTLFDDSQKGFYSTFRSLFARIAVQEDADLPMPSFGHSSSSFAQVVKPFYEAWLSFSSSLPFMHLDKYNTVHAENRRVKRLMEKENKKIRDAERKRFSDTVRELVAFVHKRDPRVKEQERRELQEKNSRKEEREERKKRERKKNEKNDDCNLEFVEQEWAKVSLDSLCISDEEDEDEEMEFYCPICDKAFKSEKQLHNHERSKKHLKLLQEFVEKEMEQEEEEEEYEDEDEEENHEEQDEENEPEEETCKKNVYSDAEIAEKIFDDADTSFVSLDTPYYSSEEGPVYWDDEEELEIESPIFKKSLFSSPSHEEGPVCEEDLAIESPVFDESLFSSSSKKNAKSLKSVPSQKQQPSASSNKKKKQNSSLLCNTCQQYFASRNQLFAHLKTTNHQQASKSK